MAVRRGSIGCGRGGSDWYWYGCWGCPRNPSPDACAGRMVSLSHADHTRCGARLQLIPRGLPAKGRRTAPPCARAAAEGQTGRCTFDRSGELSTALGGRLTAANVSHGHSRLRRDLCRHTGLTRSGAAATTGTPRSATQKRYCPPQGHARASPPPVLSAAMTRRLRPQIAPDSAHLHP
jgi:hypothetical protein